MVKLTTSKGAAWLRPMLAKDEVVLADMAELGEQVPMSTVWRLRAQMVRGLDAATDRAEWDGGWGELTRAEVMERYLEWDTATDEAALPNGTAPDSETPPEPGR